MKIQMLETVRGSLDGVTVQDLSEGEIYETVGTPIGDRLAAAHIANGVAKAVIEPVSEPIETVASQQKVKNGSRKDN